METKSWLLCICDNEKYVSKNKNKILKKFVTERLLPYYESNNINTDFETNDMTCIEIKKALNNENYNIDLMDFKKLFNMFYDCQLLEICNID